MIVVPAAFLLALACALLLTPLVRDTAKRLGSVEAPDTSFRKIHVDSTPRVGGLAIVIAFYLPLLGLFFIDSQTGALFTGEPSMAIGLLLGGLPIVVLGIYDDIIGVGAIEKFAIQIAVAISLFSIGFRIEAVSLPFDSTLQLGIFAFPLTIIWIVGLINALNLIDGLDGLAAGVAVFAAATIFAVAFAHNNLLMMLFMAALAGALLGFLVFNFNPATIFMGDTGSLFLGYVIAVTSLQTSTKGAATVALLTPVLALGLPILDTLLALGRRMLRGQNPFKGDREHIHHKLLDMGLSHRSAVLFLYTISATFALFALTVTVTDGILSAALFGAAIIAVMLFVHRLGGFVWDRRVLAERRQKNTVLRQTQRKFNRRAAEAEDIDMVWSALVDAVSDLQAARVELTPAAGSVRKQWRRQDSSVATLVIERVIPTTAGELTIAWDDGRTLLAAEEGGVLDTLVTTMDRQIMPRVVSSSLA
ncbi:MAG: undecaprenyl/decaprenyl-phosphate alpha-N-acetylglucosaminyl 1-phosphate transferase [Gammaproteobacteria bacterium]|nr:undecaprenyl/decaprenyl-phosphate alpha-N-acetylglucosaminyl 1-phosphate transferase [Gammaproteobacteria bacterium]MDH3768574.1 undecaprenyl/decaprenyl-phosphate alpha-N-acetylglucosaminyl 1-phosphate transferase [Gammaproteobacteria bacterium]